MVLEKKKAAAVAAVMQYIESEEEMIVMQTQRLSAVGAPAGAVPPVKLWGISGRQAMMQMRNLMQMRGFHGGRFR